MTIEIKGSRNYSATVIRVPKVRKAENSDRLYIIDALGITAIVDESWVAREGELALLLPAEVQLDPGFMQANNLYRDSSLNLDQTQTGYIDTNRRVRAIKLRGNISNGLVLPADGTVFPGGINWFALGEGTVFDTYDGRALCRKYVIETKQTGVSQAESKVKKAFKRVDSTYLPEHYETGQWMRERDTVADDEIVIVTQKLHGTSVRLANTIVRREMTKREKFAQKFLGAKIADHEYDLVAGSKRVIKDVNNPNQKHFYGTDVWSDALLIWGHKIPKNFVVYGELVGYTDNGQPIQKGHTYEELPGFMNLYVYRVAVITEDAEMVDLSWDQVREFCQRHGFEHVPELVRGSKGLLNIAAFEEVNFWEEHQSRIADDEFLGYRDAPVRLSDGGTGVDEGVALRIDGSAVPRLFKFKNKSHYLYESNELDTGEADLESQG